MKESLHFKIFRGTVAPVYMHNTVCINFLLEAVKVSINEFFKRANYTFRLKKSHCICKQIILGSRHFTRQITTLCWGGVGDISTGGKQLTQRKKNRASSPGFRGHEGRCFIPPSTVILVPQPHDHCKLDARQFFFGVIS